MTTHPDAQALLAGVIAEPASDAARLVYSDWLEEHGEAERAEFIRLQIELVSHPAHHTADSGCPLRRRERELLSKHWHVWIGDLDAYAACGNRDAFPHGGDSSPQHVVMTFRRGFVAEVRCRLIDWIGGECERCDVATGDRPYVDFCPKCGKRGVWDEGSRYCHSCGPQPCPRCSGTGRTPGHGPAIVAQQPIQDVEFTDVGVLSELPPFLLYGWDSGHWRPWVSLNAINWAKKQKF